MLPFHKEITFLRKNKCKGISPSNMIASLVHLNSYIYNIYMDDIADMISQIYHIHLEQYYTQQQYDTNFRNLC